MKLTESRLRKIIQEEKQKLLNEVSQSKIETFTNATWDIAADMGVQAMAQGPRRWEDIRSYLVDEVNGIVDSLVQNPQRLS